MSKNEVDIISTSTIKVESTAQINLTPWDLGLLFLEYTQGGLLFLNPNPHDQTVIHHLKASFERILHFFPAFAGRLTTTKSDAGDTTCFFIDCSQWEGGATFIHAKTHHLTAADILDSSTYATRAVHSLYPLTGVPNYVPQSLMAVQATELVDGLFLGCSYNQLVMDGTSLFRFLNSWAALSRGEITKNNPALVFYRDKINLDLVGSKSIYISDEYLIPPEKTIFEPTMLSDRLFHFTKQNVAKLKARANQEMMEISKGRISSLQAVIAHVWRSIIRHRFAMNSETTFEIPINARKRLDPPLPAEYFGNATFPGTITLDVGRVLENSLGWTSWQINRMVASYNDSDKVKIYYKNWINKPKFDMQSICLPSNYFVLINSPRFNVYGNDFGWGKPVAVRSGRSDSFDGRITVFEGSEEGSMDIEICLFAETLSSLAQDTEFMEFVTSK